MQVTPKMSDEDYKSCQFDILFENEESAYNDIIPALGQVKDFPQ